MAPRFYLTQYQELAVEMDGQREILMAPRFLRRENQAKCSEYLRTVAQQLTETYATNPDAAAEILDEAKYQVRMAKNDESALRAARFDHE